MIKFAASKKGGNIMAFDKHEMGVGRKVESGMWECSSFTFFLANLKTYYRTFSQIRNL